MAMMEQVELSDLSREQLEDIIRRTQRRQSLKGQNDVVKATAAVVRKASEKLQAEILDASQRAAQVKTVDACFLLDCTGSMHAQIEAAKQKIMEIKERLLRCLGHGGNVRFAVVGYRDYDHKESKQFEILPLTEDAKKVKSFLSRLEVINGSDICEDVVGGLGKVCQLDWQARTRIIYLICDCPPHGTRFKDATDWPNLAYDLLPDDPNQWETTDQLMQKSIALSLNMVLLDYGLQAHFKKSCLEKTFQVFSELRQTSPSASLQTLHLRPDNTADDFVQCILASTKETISKTLSQPASSKSRPQTTPGASQQLKVQTSIVWEEWQSWPLQQVLVTSMNVRAVTSHERPNQVIQSFRIRGEPFAEGNMRYAFPAASSDGKMRSVVKAGSFLSVAEADLCNCRLLWQCDLCRYTKHPTKMLHPSPGKM